MKNQDLIQSLEQMPEYLSTQHLIQLGIYPSIDAAYQARLNGYAPEYIKLRHKILYKKSNVISFLAERTKRGLCMKQKFHNYSDCEFPDYSDYAQDMLRKWLEMLCFTITLPVIINGHIEKQNEEKPDEWEYKVSFTKDVHGNVFLHVEARFTAEIGTRYKVLILIPESEINLLA